MATTNDKEWNDWTQSFLNTGKKFGDHQPMTHAESKAFISMLVMGSALQPSETLKVGLSQDFLYRVMHQRAQALHLDVMVPVLALICYICKTPGEGVMWVHALKKMQLIAGGEMVTFDNLTHHFPLGFPKPETLERLWKDQKCIGGAVANYLDTVTYAPAPKVEDTPSEDGR